MSLWVWGSGGCLKRVVAESSGPLTLVSFCSPYPYMLEIERQGDSAAFTCSYSVRVTVQRSPAATASGWRCSVHLQLQRQGDGAAFTCSYSVRLQAALLSVSTITVVAGWASWTQGEPVTPYLPALPSTRPALHSGVCDDYSHSAICCDVMSPNQLNLPLDRSKENGWGREVAGGGCTLCSTCGGACTPP